MTQRHVTTRDLARKLACSQQTIRREIARGKIPAVRVGRDFRIDLDAAMLALSNSGRKSR